MGSQPVHKTIRLGISGQPESDLKLHRCTPQYVQINSNCAWQCQNQNMRAVAVKVVGCCPPTKGGKGGDGCAGLCPLNARCV